MNLEKKSFYASLTHNAIELGGKECRRTTLLCSRISSMKRQMIGMNIFLYNRNSKLRAQIGSHSALHIPMLGHLKMYFPTFVDRHSSPTTSMHNTEHSQSYQFVTREMISDGVAFAQPTKRHLFSFLWCWRLLGLQEKNRFPWLMCEVSAYTLY